MTPCNVRALLIPLDPVGTTVSLCSLQLVSLVHQSMWLTDETSHMNIPLPQNCKTIPYFEKYKNIFLQRPFIYLEKEARLLKWSFCLNTSKSASYQTFDSNFRVFDMASHCSRHQKPVEVWYPALVKHVTGFSRVCGPNPSYNASEYWTNILYWWESSGVAATMFLSSFK